MIVNDDSSVTCKWHSPLIDDARAFIYDRNMFTIQATDQIKHLVPGLTIIALVSIATYTISLTLCTSLKNIFGSLTKQQVHKMT
jgi:hypothetical protein